MKPKTIREKIRELVFDYSKPDGLNLGDTTDEILAQIQQLLEECAPERFNLRDTNIDSLKYAERAGFNQAIDQYKSNLQGKLK